jgi:hypothetical protein
MLLFLLDIADFVIEIGINNWEHIELKEVF